MIATSSVEPFTTEFRPLAPLLRPISHEKLNAARLRVSEFHREVLIESYRAAFADGRRIAAFILADELTKRGIPPCFRLENGSLVSETLEQNFDLFLADMNWLRHWYPDHAKIVRYRRCKTMLAGTGLSFHREAEYAFWQGKRPAWRIVQSLSLDQRQQWDCAWLRSAPIKKQDTATQAMRDRVFAALRDDLQAVRRTKSFTDNDAQTTLTRRFELWLCSRMANGSPAETARRYTQMTGREITRDVTARQLQKVNETLMENG